MNIFIRKVRGSISIFLVLVMLTMFICAGLTVDGARISAARNAASGAGDLAMNAALSEYNTVLKDVYGLFAMSETMEELESNVSRYFSNTINNTGILEGSDSYTRSFINSIGSLFSTDEISFDNIVDTQVESFALVEVTNSALANPTVLERQIIDYMKYRGPVNMGGSMLTKLGCIGETSKQTKVLEAKIDYEKKLDTVQKACEAAYKAINEFNDAITNSKFNEANYLQLMNADIESSYNYNLQMTEYIISSKSPDLAVGGLKENSEIRKAAEQEIKQLTGENINRGAFEYIRERIGEFISFSKMENGEYELVQSEFYELVDNLMEGYEDTIDGQISFIISINKAGFNDYYTYLNLYKEYYERLSEEEKLIFQKEKEEYLSTLEKIDDLIEKAKKIPEEWKKNINAYGSSGAKVIYDNWYAKIDDISDKLQDAIDSLDIVLIKAGNLGSARENWGGKVDELSESDIKTSMEGDYINSAKDLNETEVNSLIQVLSDSKKHFSEIKRLLEKIKYYDKSVCIGNSDNVNYINRFTTISEQEIAGAENLHKTAISLMDSKYVSQNLEQMSSGEFIKITEKQKFYKYLKNICKNIDGEGGDRADAKQKRTALINLGNSQDSKTADTSGLKTGNIVGEGGISEAISEAIDALAGKEETGESGFNPKKVDSAGSDKEIAEDNKDNLSAISSLLEGLSDIGATVRDKVYLEEYFTEMFSCYTSGKGEEEAETLTLSNVDMSDNKFYRSEVEYILWGNNDVSANLNSTKAMIFGVRFALNSIYAFTSSDTRTPAMSAATAIAGWTGFGVPLVQTVILLAWSMAESVIDVNNLCNGEEVCIYKSKDTWVLGINGVKNFAKETASKTVGDIFSKIQNTAEDSIDDVAGYVEDYVSKTMDSVTDSIKSSIMTAVERLALQIIGEAGMELQKSDVENKVDEMLASLESSISGDSIIEEAKRAAICEIKVTSFYSLGGQTPREYIVNEIYEAYLNAKEGVVSGISERINKMICSISEAVNEKVREIVSGSGDALKGTVSDIVSSGEELVKEKVISAIDKYTADISGNDIGGKTVFASAMTLTYKEYLKVFVLMSLLGNETSMLKRCAKLIQANISQQEADFNISRSCTMVEINACISVRTTFFNIPVTSKTGRSGEVVYDLDFSNIGSDRQRLKYVGILGY